jgi:hypothetical protein
VFSQGIFTKTPFSVEHDNNLDAEMKKTALAIVGLLTIGLNTWMVVPSLSASLKEGLSSYANNVATYIFIYNTGAEDYGYRLNQSYIDEIAALEGVREVYPIIVNSTHFKMSEKGILGCFSAVIGGKSGFPQSLISISEGKIPENEAGFLINGLGALGPFSMNQTYNVIFETGPNVEIPINASTFTDFRGRR